MAAASISKIIDIQSQAISSNSNGFNLAGMVLDKNTIIPNKTILTFTSALQVSNYFGSSSDEYKYAQYYFNTYTTNTNRPAFIKYYYFATEAQCSWVRGAALGTTDLAALRAITSGTLTVTFGGTAYTATGIDLSDDTSFSQMAATIQTALQDELATATVTWDSITSAFTIFSNVDNDTVAYPGNTPLAAAMKIEQSTGAVLSQGNGVVTPAQNMNNIINKDTNWFNFTTLFAIWDEEDYVTALALMTWLNSQTLQFAYTYWTLETVLGTSSTPAGFALAAIDTGYATQQLNSKGEPVVMYNIPIVVLYGSLDLAHAIMGTGAAIDYTVLNGTISFNAKTFAGITPLINDDSLFDNLVGNGCNFYAVFDNRGSEYDFYELGTVGGDFLWLDNLYNDAWQLNQQVTALANLQAALPKLPANSTGEGYVNAELVNVANLAIKNGTIGIGNTFTPTVIAELKQLAGSDISNILTQAGYYIKITTDRANRTINYLYFYTVSGAIVFINGSIIAVL